MLSAGYAGLHDPEGRNSGRKDRGRDLEGENHAFLIGTYEKVGASESTLAPMLVRVVIQNFLKKPVIATVFKADE